MFAIAEDGSILLKISTEEGMYRVLAYMIGKLIAAKLKATDDPGLTLGDLAVLSNINVSELNTLIAKSKYFVYVGHGKFRFNTVHLKEALDELERAPITES
uniref:Uncharacterized protein n=1 Tax=Caldiarchaeum subterraneum TaxID=311458 RepID=E6NBL0_CALS0|nr:hypothetical protein HGMM_F28H09C18 [Candidatus Caldarchaeum subterraneum]